MQAPFTALNPSKMFDSVGDINFVPRDAGLGKCFIEDLARRAHEWMPLAIFHVAGLLPTKMILACADPSPKTVWVAFLYRSHPRQHRAAVRKLFRSRRFGRKSAADVFSAFAIISKLAPPIVHD